MSRKPAHRHPRQRALASVNGDPARKYRVSGALFIVLALTACADDPNYKRPTLHNSSASTMSRDTLCYRYASTRDEGLAAEVKARGLDCAEILEGDPLYR